ncbi:threonine/serine ThrE exporter family protein [Bifidobacterium pseudolongum]|uniref:threonine/serine ThrE exporter family protein n=1 Tax=Bifidobacterium pseudolongum TaxID=1694 RepID=UPI0010F30437|nr:threonine/serine exporter family protein [Bifidobacterium pseudolongum]RYQ32932.1 putative threonine/serine exporter [Bifidobacterium pseudolongum subsp. globosum]
MQEEVKSGATAVGKYHSHSIPLDMEDIERDWDKPIADAGIAAKASVIVRVGMLDLGAGTGSFRVREMMHRIAYPLDVHVRADVNLTDIQATCTDGKDRITEVVNLPTTGVNTERIWLLEHFADWFSVNLGTGSMYHRETKVSAGLMQHLDMRDASQVSADMAKRLREERHHARVAERAAVEDYEAALASHGTVSGSGEVNETVIDALVKADGRGDAASEQAEQLDLPRGQRGHRQAPAGERAHTNHEITVRDVHKRLDMIERRKPLYSPALSGLASACACASFVFLLGGASYDMIGAFVGAGLGQWLRRRLFAHHLNQFFVTFVCVAVAAFACVGTLRLIGLFNPLALQHDTAYIGAMLFVIPGFPLITGGLDMAKIDFPSGVQRVMYVLCIILMATLAGWMIASLVHLNPQGFESPNLNPWVNGTLRALFAFIGVWGFSMMFNSPQRMCLVAATIGMITDTLRLELVDYGLAPEAGAFIGAMLAGLLASAWRSAVRHGMLPPHLGYPRICLTVPSIVIMVPGMYMYQAMFHLGQFETLLALDWAFRAFMVIICLPIGLAMARVITDKSWRYDV